MHCPLDDRIPFCELFLIPYLFWFIFLVGIHLCGRLFTAWHYERLQHSVLDLLAALPICLIAYYVCFRRGTVKKA